jgi:hypothetical protein
MCVATFLIIGMFFPTDLVGLIVGYTLYSILIDISWLDWAYNSSTCGVMYRRQRRHLYYGGQI